MAGDVRYPSLYQINTRVWLRRLSRQHGKTVTLKDVADEELGPHRRSRLRLSLAAVGLQTGEASRAVSRSHPGWQQEFRETLPDLTEDEIGLRDDPLYGVESARRCRRSRRYPWGSRSAASS